MRQKLLRHHHLEAFRNKLITDEKSPVTIEKYLRDARAFIVFCKSSPVSKELMMTYKQHLIDSGYASGSINSMLASINSLLDMLGWQDCKVKNLRVQKPIYCAEEKELSKAEYVRLLRAAKNHPQLRLVMETICSTGIRVSELKYFTIEALHKGEVTVTCKNKMRTILIPSKLKRILLKFTKRKGIRTGIVFVTKGGKPLNRSNIWSQMKHLCRTACVASSKVFPHNLRKLFARTFYAMEKDIAKLADVLGHSSINTTRIYIMSSGTEHRKRIEKLGLVI